MFRPKFVKFFMPILKRQVDSSPNFAFLSTFMKDIFSVLFLFQKNWDFQVLGSKFVNSSCQLWKYKSVPLQIFRNSSLSWQITPLWILSWYLFKFGLKDPVKIPILSALEKTCHIPHVIIQTTSQLKVMLDKSVNNVLGKGM